MSKYRLPGFKTHIISALAFLKGFAGMWVVASGMLDGGMSVMEIISSDSVWNDPNMVVMLGALGVSSLRAGVAKAEKPSN